MSSQQEDKKKAHHRYLMAQKRFFDSSKILQQNKDSIKEFMEEKFLELGTEPNWETYRVKYSSYKKICEDFFPDKVLLDLTHEDIKEFRSKFQTNEFKQQNGLNYSAGYKEKLINNLNEYFKEMLTKKQYDDKVFTLRGQKNILSIKYKRDHSIKDQVYFTYTEIKKLIDNIDDIRYKFYFAAGFDGGFRINEFRNIKKKHTIFEKQENYQYLRTNVYYSTKTGEYRPVDLSMFMPIYKAYFEYLLQNYQKLYGEPFSEESRIFTLTEQVTNRRIKKYVKDILQREDFNQFHNHSLRHSSATHYANYVDIGETEFYWRFGWSLQSDEAKTYTKQIKARKSDIIKKVYSSSVNLETQDLRKEIEEMKQQQLEDKQNIQQLQNDLNYVLERFKSLKF